MSFEERLNRLTNKHETLDDEIESEVKRPLPNDIHIHDLKKQKLLLKDKIAGLRSQGL